MDKEKLLFFLTTEFRGKNSNAPLTIKAARDVYSRCKRVETVLQIDLEKYAKSKKNARDELIERIRHSSLNVSKLGGSTKNLHQIYVNAVSRYFDYLDK